VSFIPQATAPGNHPAARSAPARLVRVQRQLLVSHAVAPEHTLWYEAKIIPLSGQAACQRRATVWQGRVRRASMRRWPR